MAEALKILKKLPDGMRIYPKEMQLRRALRLWIKMNCRQNLN